MIGAEIHGKIKEFDDERGVGVVAGDGAEFPFHCTQIAGGARMIEPGTPVEFEVAAGLPGRWEAVAIRPVGAA